MGKTASNCFSSPPPATHTWGLRCSSSSSTVCVVSVYWTHVCLPACLWSSCCFVLVSYCSQFMALCACLVRLVGVHAVLKSTQEPHMPLHALRPVSSSTAEHCLSPARCLCCCCWRFLFCCVHHVFVRRQQLDSNATLCCFAPSAAVCCVVGFFLVSGRGGGRDDVS